MAYTLMCKGGRVRTGTDKNRTPVQKVIAGAVYLTEK